jgi:serine/threonine-protein kinase PpkA
MSLSAGTRLDAYEIIDVVGAGGMGEVYRARDTRLNRDVAIKVLPEHLAVDPDALARFEREAQAVAALSHPNILAIHDFGRHGDVTYAVTELLEGETLRVRLTGGALPTRRALEYAIQIVGGIAAAHERGIVHRDLKPENILVRDDGIVALTDFGIAKHVGMLITDTGAGDVVGTPYYLSPEQAMGNRVDARADLYSLGVMLFEMLTGTKPYHAESARELLRKHVEEPVPELPAALQWCQPLLDRLMAKEPQQRCESASRLLEELAMLANGMKGRHLGIE